MIRESLVQTVSLLDTLPSLAKINHHLLMVQKSIQFYPCFDSNIYVQHMICLSLGGLRLQSQMYKINKTVRYKVCLFLYVHMCIWKYIYVYLCIYVVVCVYIFIYICTVPILYLYMEKSIFIYTFYFYIHTLQ